MAARSISVYIVKGKCPMGSRRSLALLVALLALGMALWQGAAIADTQAQRVDIEPGEQLQLACPEHAQLVIRPESRSAALVTCEGEGHPAPGPTTKPGQTPTPRPEAQAHPAGCKPGEVFQDSQDWWAHDDPERDFGHLHTQICFPVNATLDEPYEVTVTSVLHRNPGRFYRLMMQSFDGGLDGDDNICNDTTAVQCKSFSRTLADCEATGGTLSDHGETCRWRDSFTIDPEQLASSGWQQFRFRAFVDEPDGTRMATSTSLHAEVENGKSRSRLYRDYATYNYLRGRGWYTDAQYASAYLIDAEQLMEPISGIWEPEVHFQAGRNHDGASPARITGHMASIDTDFHQGNEGTVLLKGEGQFHGNLRIDTRKLSNGWHRLFLKADQRMPDGHTHSGVLAVWFEVKN